MGLSADFDAALPGVNLIKVRSIGLGSVRNSKASTMTKAHAQQSKSVVVKSKLIKLLNWFMFPDKAVFWIPFVMLYILRNRNTVKSDIIWSTSPLVTNHIIARFICLGQRGIKHITDFRDYHYLHNEANTHGLKGWLHKKIENYLLKKSSFSTFISNGMRDQYITHYPKLASKFVTIYNGFDVDEFENARPIVNSKKLTFFYAGSFYGGLRSPKPLLLSLEALLNKGEISRDDFCIEIAGNMEQKILDDLKSMEIFSSIHFLGLLQRNEVLKKYRESHILWSIVSNNINHYTGVPIKFYEYLGSQRYILNYAKPFSETSELINALNCGWSLPNTEEINDSHLEVIRTILGNTFKRN